MPHPRRLALALLGWLTACIVIAVPASAQEPLRVCLQADDPPLSSRRTGEPAGFDVALAQLIGRRLGRPLTIRWFTTPDDPDSNPVTEADALLSDGHCDFVAGYPLVADTLGRPRAGIGKLPPFEGAKPEDRRRWITLGELVATRAYRLDAITVALAPSRSQRSVHALADLAGLRLGVVLHGLPDLIAMSYRHGELADRVIHFTTSRALFEQLENSDVDAALVDQRELDAWRLIHPGTRVVSTGYRHSLGFNIGFVGLSSDRALIARIDGVLGELLDHGDLANIAQANGMTYIPPLTPDITPGVTLGALSGD